MTTANFHGYPISDLINPDQHGRTMATIPITVDQVMDSLGYDEEQARQFLIVFEDEIAEALEGLVSQAVTHVYECWQAERNDEVTQRRSSFKVV